MKRINVIALSIALIATVSHAATSAHSVTNVEEVTSNVIARVRAYASNTNRIAGRSGIPLGIYLVTNAQAIAEIDDILSAKPPFAILLMNHVRNRLPKTAAAAVEYYKDSKPNLVKKVTKGIEGMTRAEIAACSVESVSLFSEADLSFHRDMLAKTLSRLIIPALRRQGKAITNGPDGRSPIKEFADRIQTAINEAGFAGLNEILDELGVPAHVDANYIGILSVKDASALVEKIMSGEEILTPYRRAVISASLGVDAYNAFVERYNGGTR